MMTVVKKAPCGAFTVEAAAAWLEGGVADGRGAAQALAALSISSTMERVGGGGGVQPAKTAHGQHEQVELQGHFTDAVIDDAIVAVHAQLIGVTAAFLPAGADDVVDLFVVISHIELLTGEHAKAFVIPRAFGEQATAKGEIAAIVVFSDKCLP